MEKKLSLYNTLSRKKELFDAAHNEVGLYCCGPTVYNFAHIGNLRTYVFEDVLKRTLLALGYTVKHVVNITDVGHLTSDADSGDDKMEMGAQREGKTVWDIARYYTEEFMKNIRDLCILDADIWPRATDHIPEMIAMIRKLEENGVTYGTDDGIYFDTSKFGAYCDFAGLDPASLRAGSRVALGDKRSITDFALWKFSPTDKKRMMEWESPWGVGFPGWHIECSAMSLKYLAQPIDIHCGGIDHIRIHHTNEIAQVEAATGRQYVRYWLHGEFLVLEKGKMAKSSGEFITLESLKQKKIDPLAYRLFCYTAHYRSPLSFSWEGIDNAANSLKNIRGAVLKQTEGAARPVDDARTAEQLMPFWAALYDDLNMPQAMAAIWDILHETSFSPDEKRSALQIVDTITALDLFASQPQKQVIRSHPQVKIFAPGPVPDDTLQRITHLAIERIKARKARDYAGADRFRNELKSIGVEIRDCADGSADCDLST